MKKADNAESFLFSNRLENLSALLKNGVLDNMSNLDQLYDYILWYFGGLMPVQFMVIAGYIIFCTKNSYGRSEYMKGENLRSLKSVIFGCFVLRWWLLRTKQLYYNIKYPYTSKVN